MATVLPLIAPEAEPAQAGYFSWPIPKIIHEVTASDAQAASVATRSAWRAYADRHGYLHRVWSAGAAGAELQALAGTARGAADISGAFACGGDSPQDDGSGQESHGAVAERDGRAAGRAWALAEAGCWLEAYRQLASSGGIFVGPWARPPQQGEDTIDLADRLPMRGLVLATALHARHVDGASLYVTPHFIAAAPGHPLVVHWAATAADNVRHRLAHSPEPVAVRYLTGSAFLSRTMSGTFAVMPYPYLQRLGLFP